MNPGQSKTTNGIGPTTKTAAKERDQSETESTVETEKQRQVKREQACVNLERQNAEQREDRLRVSIYNVKLSR